MILNLQKSSRNGAKNSHLPFSWIEQLLTFCHIGSIYLPTLRHNFFFLNHLKVNYRHLVCLPQTLQYIFSKNKDILFHIHSPVISFWEFNIDNISISVII